MSSWTSSLTLQIFKAPENGYSLLAMRVLATRSKNHIIPKIGQYFLRFIPDLFLQMAHVSARIPENCAFTTQHSDPEKAQTTGAPPTAGFGMPNGGLQVVNPSLTLYNDILSHLKDSSAINNYEFADQSLLSDLFEGRWVTLPYIYNALKTIAWEGVHKPIWRDDKVKNIHYILSPKPWDEKEGEETYETHKWWTSVNKERVAEEKKEGIEDGF